MEQLRIRTLQYSMCVIIMYCSALYPSRMNTETLVVAQNTGKRLKQDTEMQTEQNEEAQVGQHSLPVAGYCCRTEISHWLFKLILSKWTGKSLEFKLNLSHTAWRDTVHHLHPDTSVAHVN